MDTPARAQADERLGLLLDGRYRVVALVARGGMGTVYTGLDERLDRRVAVKVMHRVFAEDPSVVARFTREARLAARLSAPEAVAVFDQGRDPATGLAYLVMEYVEGRNLRDLLRQRGALSAPRALSLMEPVLRALAAAHSAGLVHRDVKPENVLLGDDGRIKVADFGLARAVEAGSATATSGLLIGTAAYLAPEQVQHGTADARTDVYAAGVVLWEMLTGSPPYAGTSPLSVAYHHVHEDIPPPSTVTPDVPRDLDDLVVRATRRDPQRRPADAAAFLAELAPLRAALPPPAARATARTDPDSATTAATDSAANAAATAADSARTPVSPPGPPADQPAPRHDTLVVPRPGPSSVRLAVPRRSRKRRSGPRRRWPLVLLVTALVLAAAGTWYVAAGRYTVAPGVLGTPVAEAEQKLRGQGFAVAVLPEPRFDEQVPAGQVLSQRPEPGRRLARGGQVTLMASKGADRRVVPTVVGSTQEAAGAAMRAAGLRVGRVDTAFSARPSGTVLSSDPPAGQPVRPATAVGLTISKGPEQLPVPDVTGKAQDQAVAALRAAGFLPAVKEVFDEAAPRGIVTGQSPSIGTAARGGTVTLTVSRGPDLVAVPDVTGTKRGDAVRTLTQAGLAPSVVTLPLGPGVVQTQDPGPNASVPRGSAVRLFVY